MGRDVPIEVDPGWDEFDFQHVVEVHKPLYRDRTLMMADLARTGRPREAVPEGLRGGHHPVDRRRLRDRLPRVVRGVLAPGRRGAQRTADRASGHGTVVVVSSGGPIGLAASHLLAGDTSLWGTLNRVAVNTGVTKVIAGRGGLTLSAYNEHTHLEHDRRLLTYR